MTDENELLARIPTDLYVGGEWRPASTGARFDVVDPSTGEPIASVADASPEDGEAALAAAHEAQRAWSRTPPRQRGELLRRAFELVTERADEFALLMTLETVSYTHLTLPTKRIV